MMRAIRYFQRLLKSLRLYPTAARQSGKLSASDHIEIHQLIAQYAFAEDFGMVDEWVDTFTNDGSFTGLRKNFVVNGHDQLREFARKRLERPGVLNYIHFTGNVKIIATAEGARSSSYSIMVENDPDQGLIIRGLAIKTDELRMVAGRWKFRSRVNAPWP